MMEKQNKEYQQEEIMERARDGWVKRMQFKSVI